MNRRDFFRVLAVLPFLGMIALTIKGYIKKNGQRVPEGERIMLLDTGEIFFVRSVTDSSDRLGNPISIIKA